MAHNTEAGDTNKSGIPVYVVEAVVAFVLLVVGCVVIYQAIQLGARWTSNGPGSGYFPFYIGLILAVSSVATLFNGLVKKRNTSIFIDHEQLRRVGAVLIPIGIYILAVKWLGLYIGSTLYIAGFMIGLGKYSWFKGLLVGLIVSVVFFMAFEVWFQVPLYKGEWDLLGWTGY